MKVVYFMEVMARHKSDRLIKIGSSADVLRRRDELSHTAPFELRILAVLPWRPGLEVLLRRYCASAHIRGEYFEPIQELWDCIRALQGGARVDSVRDIHAAQGIGRQQRQAAWSAGQRALAELTDEQLRMADLRAKVWGRDIRQVALEELAVLAGPE